LQGFPVSLEVNRENKKAIGQELLNLSRTSFRGHLVRYNLTKAFSRLDNNHKILTKEIEALCLFIFYLADKSVITS